MQPIAKFHICFQIQATPYDRGYYKDFRRPATAYQVLSQYAYQSSLHLICELTIVLLWASSRTRLALNIFSLKDCLGILKNGLRSWVMAE